MAINKENAIKLPQTGANMKVIAIIGVVILSSLIGYKKFKKYRFIK